MNCKKCARQFICEQFNTVQSCSQFKSFLEVKNYGKVEHIKNGR